MSKGFYAPRVDRTPRELLPAGRYEGVLISLIDLGTQPGGQYAPRRKILLGLELQRRGKVLRRDDGEPVVRSLTRTLSLFERSKLRPDVEALLGRPLTEDEADGDLDLSTLIGRACSVSCRHVTRGDGQGMYAELSLSPIDPEDEVTAHESDVTVYELDPSGSIPPDLPSWVGDKIRASEEWRAVNGGYQRSAPAQQPRPAGRSMAAGGPAPATRTTAPAPAQTAHPEGGSAAMSRAMAEADKARARFAKTEPATTAEEALEVF